ncbi:MAG: class I SAM-dependent methyltransferase [Nitrospirota bacterium]
MLGDIKLRDPAHFAKVVQFYAQVSAKYDGLTEPYFLNVRRLYRQCLDEIFVERRFGGPFDTVLDVGCGTGAQVIFAAQHARRVIGVDPSKESLAEARRKADAQGLTNIELHGADLSEAPIQAGSVDCVLSYGDVLSHIPWYERTIEAVSRACKPGALFSFECDNKWYPGLLRDRSELKTALQNVREGHARTWHIDGQALEFNTFTHKELTQLLEKHRFRLLRTYGFDFFTYLVPERYHFETAPGWRRGSAMWLARLDIRLAGCWPVNRLGYSKILFARRY